MSPLVRSIAPLVFALCILEAKEVSADVPPPGFCMTLGAACNKAGPNQNLPGVCGPGMCTRAGGAAGAAGVISYFCLVCELANGGAGGNGAAGGGNAGEGGAIGGSGGSDGVVDDGGCSCSLRALGSERGVATLMLGLGLLALRISRRRK